MGNGLDKIEMSVSGEVFDSIVAKEDTSVSVNGEEILLRKGEEFSLPKNNNLVLRSATEIISSLLKGNSSFYENVWWEVGSGSSNWEDSNLPSPSLNDKGLLSPLYRKKIELEDIKFLDNDGKYSEKPTNKIEMVTTFGLNEANGYLREFSIYFGGDSKLGSGIPFNRKIHGVIFKTESIELRRKIHFTTNLTVVNK